jgi:hypothetical protein
MNDKAKDLNKVFKEKFTQLFWVCLSQGFTTVESRNYASLELTGKLFHVEQSLK